MNKIALAAKSVGRLIDTKAPSILTGAAVAGVIATAVLAVRATPEALELVRKAETKDDSPFWIQSKPIERVKVAWKPYIPAALTGVTTIICIVGSNRISTKRQAALVSAFSVTAEAYREYRQKVVETIGDRPEENIRAAVAKDQIEANPPQSNEIIVAGSGQIRCYDQFSGRYFMSDYETLRKAENDFNQQLLYASYASLNDFYSMIGLPGTHVGDEFGWKPDRMLELKFAATLGPDHKPCLAITFDTDPIRDYWRGHS